MNAGIKIAAPLVLAMAGALAATGFANSSRDTTNMQATATPAYTAPMTNDTAAAPMTNDGQMTTARADEASPVARDAASAPAPSYTSHRHITVTAPRPSDDELLRNAVMLRLNNDSHLGGKIGVEAYRHTVSLTGRVTTTGQIERAGMIARSIDGVWEVDNQLLARVGMS